MEEIHQWALSGPKQAWFSKGQLAAYLGISERTIDRLIRDGRFPVGIKVSAQADPRWSGLDIAAYLYLRSRCPGGNEEENLPAEEN